MNVTRWVTRAAVALVATGSAGTLLADPLRTDRAVTIVVGTPGGARVDRVDPRRTGMARFALPDARLRVAWRDPVRAVLEHAAVVDARGVAYVAGTHGEVVAIDDQGAERWHAATGAVGAGPPALLSDDTIAFVDGSGEAFGVRDGRVRWKTYVGPTDPARPVAPLALDDGGLLAAAGFDLVALNGAGQEKARARLAEPIVAPLVAASDRVLAVTSSGAVWSWAPGALEAARVGAFGSPIEGSAALADDGTLVAVTHAGARLTAVLWREGRARTRAASSGSLWIGSPAVAQNLVLVLALTAAGELAVAVDPSGQEVGSTLLQPATIPADGGPLALPTAPPTPILVDASATVMFATAAGTVGAARRLGLPDVSVETLAGVCSPGTGSAPFSAAAGIAPAGPGAVVVACRHGDVVGVRSSPAPTQR